MQSLKQGDDWRIGNHCPGCRADVEQRSIKIEE